jgi:DNA-binding GntR family transcriptional regulator
MSKTKLSRAEKTFRSITKSIAEELRGAIVAGKLVPGERLVEDQLAAPLRVGRVPLREATQTHHDADPGSLS